MMDGQEMMSYEDVSMIHICLFRILGILPYEDDDDSSTFRKFLRKNLPGIYCHIVNTIYNTMYLGYGIRMIMQLGRLDVDYICELVIVQGVCLRYLILYLQRRDLLHLTKLCRDLWLFVKLQEAEVVRLFERKVYYLRNFFLWNSLLAVTFYIMTAQFVRIPPADANGTALRVLPYKFYLDVQEEPWYLLVSILQGIVCYSIAVILTGIETVGPYLIMMACGYLRIVHDRLYAMTEIPDDYNIVESHRSPDNDRLCTDDVLVCVKFHQKILEFCDGIDRFTRSLFMVQVLCTIYNMSLIGIKLLENDKNALRYMSILVLNLLQFFTCQWIPEHLLNESEAIADAAYSASLAHRNYARQPNQMLLLTMLRAEKPIQLTAGGYVRLSLESFEKMIVNAFSFFTVLRSFSD